VKRAGCLALLLLPGCLLFSSCGRPPQPNIVLVTLDTTRADRFGFAGHTAARTPNFDALAAESWVFRQAMAPAPLTLPAHATLLTGTFPILHGVYYNDGFRVAEDLETLPEILRGAGYETAAFVSAFPLDSQFRLDQGFGRYDDDFGRAEDLGHVGFAERRADETNEAVRRYLEKRRSGKSLFLWVHYFDPHAPYAPPPPYDSLFSGSLYDGEIAFLDEQLGRLREMLAANLGEGPTILAVAGDHGEGLGEHGEPSHSAFIYDSTMHVPLLLRLPGGGRGEVAQQVRTADLLPTLLGELGLAVPAEVQGRDLRPLLQPGGAPIETDDAYLESRYCQLLGWAPLRALRTGSHKLILAPRRELYDLEADPGEVDNLAERQPALVAELEERLLRLERRLKGPALDRSAAAGMADEEALRKLASLGYAGARLPVERYQLPSPQELAGLGNPRDKTEILYWRNALIEALDSGRPEEAAIAGRRMLDLDPANPALRGMAAMARAAAGEKAPAIAELQEVTRAIPTDGEAHLVLGRLLRERGGEGDREYARRELEAAAELEPRAERYFELATLLLELGDEKAFEKAFARAREIDPSATGLEIFAGRRALEKHDLEAAERSFAEVLRRLPSSRSALAGRVELARRRGDPEEEEKALRDLLRSVPADASARLRYAELLAGRDPSAAREQLELVEKKAADPELRREAARRRSRISP
jgi:choline-sulfatase